MKYDFVQGSVQVTAESVEENLILIGLQQKKEAVKEVVVTRTPNRMRKTLTECPAGCGSYRYLKMHTTKVHPNGLSSVPQKFDGVMRPLAVTAQ